MPSLPTVHASHRTPPTGPIILPRSQHTISRRSIDADALKVLYRLKDQKHLAYLVGGSVRDLLLGRRPKDFDVGTSAHPSVVKRLFRNCWIIGRRFRLAHVRFGSKVIEVATFRRHVPAGTEAEPPMHEPTARAGPPPSTESESPQGAPADRHRQYVRDNTFGTPEEDAFRRDFTINALFYDIASFSVIDYVGGLQDLDARLMRCIGDPDGRFIEDPIRMLRAIALAARLDFQIDTPTYDAILRHRAAITRSAPARLLEELYKILRSGASARVFRGLAEAGLLAHIAPETNRMVSDRFWQSLGDLDAYHARFEAVPSSLTSTILLGTLVVPLGMLDVPDHSSRPPRDGAPEQPDVSLGDLPVARRDIERIRRIVALCRRMRDPRTSERVQRRLTFGQEFQDALTWIEIHDHAPALLEHWCTIAAGSGTPSSIENGTTHRRRRKRRRRRGGGPAPPRPAPLE